MVMSVVDQIRAKAMSDEGISPEEIAAFQAQTDAPQMVEAKPAAKKRKAKAAPVVVVAPPAPVQGVMSPLGLSDEQFLAAHTQAAPVVMAPQPKAAGNFYPPVSTLVPEEIRQVAAMAMNEKPKSVDFGSLKEAVAKQNPWNTLMNYFRR